VPELTPVAPPVPVPPPVPVALAPPVPLPLVPPVALAPPVPELEPPVPELDAPPVPEPPASSFEPLEEQPRPAASNSDRAAPRGKRIRGERVQFDIWSRSHINK
jgi:hypothetical protein